LIFFIDPADENAETFVGEEIEGVAHARFWFGAFDVDWKPLFDLVCVFIVEFERSGF
jgi:hypothetical protein